MWKCYGLSRLLIMQYCVHQFGAFFFFFFLNKLHAAIKDQEKLMK